MSEEYKQCNKEYNSGGLRQGNGRGCGSWHSNILPLEKAYKTMTGHRVEYNNPDDTRNFIVVGGFCG